MLTSAKNPKVAGAARLRKRAFREQDRRFLVEGAQTVAEALEAGALEALFTVDDLDAVAVSARHAGVETHQVTDEVVRHLTSTVTPQALVGVAAFLDVGLDRALRSSFDGGRESCVVVAHEIRDPGNAGTLLRSADAAGAGAIVFSETSVDVYNPKAVRASAGSVFHLPVVRGVATLEAIRATQAAGARVLAMAGDGSDDLYRTDLTDRVAFVFGNEAHGLPREIVDASDASVRVPQSPRAESLNLAAAASVCLFEWRRRRRHATEALELVVSAAAHDIRSPLTAMKGFGYALERRWRTMTEEQRALMLHGIAYDADRMDTIVRQLLDAARVVAGTLEVFPEQVDVGAVVNAVGEGQRRDPDHPAVEWVGTAGTFFADPDRLKTCLIAFCESLVWWGDDGAIVVDGDIVEDVLSLSASRSASGLTDDEVEALFTPRRPGEGSASKIGLFVARGVTEAQDGRCWGSIGSGTLTFHLRLPLAPTPPWG